MLKVETPERLELLLLSRGLPAKRRGSWVKTSTICHLGDSRDGLALAVNAKGYVSGKCFTRSCPQDSIRQALERQLGSDWTPPAPAPQPSLSPQPETKAMRLWEWAKPIPPYPDHPANLWAALKTGSPNLPPNLRWLSPRQPGDSGSLVAGIAAPGDDVSAVQLIAVNGNGSPGKDRGGLGKRSYGITSGKAFIAGFPHGNPLIIAEGIADVLTLLKHFPNAELWGVLGTAGMLSPLMAARTKAAIRNERECWIFPDQDPEGMSAAVKLRNRITGWGGEVRLIPLPGGKDPSDALKETPI